MRTTFVGSFPDEASQSVRGARLPHPEIASRVERLAPNFWKKMPQLAHATVTTPLTIFAVSAIQRSALHLQMHYLR
jgi:hypothetical protein